MDKMLEELQTKTSDTMMWDSYDQHYDWTWTDRPLLVPLTLNFTAGVMLRDWTIAKKLKELGIKKVLDVGSDTGHFLAVLKYHGIDAVGIDANKKACEFINSKGQNKCYNVGIQTLVNSNIEDYDCLTCMNITQAKWENEDLKNQFIVWANKHFDYAVLSDCTHQDKKWKNFEVIYDFNFLPVYCSPFIIKIAGFFKIEKIISYSCIQKLYRLNKHK